MGPDFWLTVRPSGVARFTVSRWPILAVTSGQVSAAATFPPVWTAIPSNQFRLERPALGQYGTAAPDAAGTGAAAVLIAPGYVSWLNGRDGYTVQVTYVNGWPHTSLTATVAAAASSIAVDDCTGWIGVTGTIYDGEFTESVQVTATSVTSGPGTLTLATALANGHASGVLFTSMPASVQQAAIYLASAEALQRGGTATTVQTMAQSGAGSSKLAAADSWRAQACTILDSYKRVI